MALARRSDVKLLYFVLHQTQMSLLYSIYLVTRVRYRAPIGYRSPECMAVKMRDVMVLPAPGRVLFGDLIIRWQERYDKSQLHQAF